MKSLEEYKKEIEQDPKARRRLKKLEKEFQNVEENLTEEELVKYGLKPEETENSEADNSGDMCDAGKIVDTSGSEVDSVLDVLSHRI